mmetsp:Transcript_5700/g.23071  ORF Transcript_5700/g.23071 Transcript_5700/m.23071 type:complete len:237 (+) Transcript_5700:399-1109(+)
MRPRASRSSRGGTGSGSTCTGGRCGGGGTARRRTCEEREHRRRDAAFASAKMNNTSAKIQYRNPRLLSRNAVVVASPSVSHSPDASRVKRPFFVSVFFVFIRLSSAISRMFAISWKTRSSLFSPHQPMSRADAAETNASAATKADRRLDATQRALPRIPSFVPEVINLLDTKTGSRMRRRSAASASRGGNSRVNPNARSRPGSATPATPFWRSNPRMPSASPARTTISRSRCTTFR